MGDFVFNLSPNLVAGADILISLGDYVSKYGSRFMLIVDPAFKDVELLVRIKQSLEQKSLKLFSFDGMQRTADSETVVRALRLAQVAHVDGVIALGDVITCSIAKSVASLYNETKPIYNYLEGEIITEAPIPTCVPSPTSTFPAKAALGEMCAKFEILQSCSKTAPVLMMQCLPISTLGLTATFAMTTVPSPILE